MSGQLEGMVIPKHVALILDGNGRWAKKRGLPRSIDVHEAVFQHRVAADGREVEARGVEVSEVKGQVAC